jgi:hypothetical protein
MSLPPIAVRSGTPGILLHVVVPRLQRAGDGSFFPDDQWMCTILQTESRRSRSMVSVLRIV